MDGEPRDEPPIRVAILTAMRSELAPLRGRLGLEPSARQGRRVHEGSFTTGDGVTVELVALVTRMGTTAATETASWALDVVAPHHVVVVGVAGGVDRDLRIGDVVVPRSVVDRASDRTLHPVALTGLDPAGVIVTSDELQYGATMHAWLAEKGATAVDMETASIGLVCEDRGVPWTAIRAISDRVDQHAEEYDVFGLAKPDGSPDVGAALRYVARNPRRIPYLMALGKGAARATTAAASVAASAIRAHPWGRPAAHPAPAGSAE